MRAEKGGSELERLAEANGIQTSYRDLQKKDVHASPGSLIAALKGMDVIESAADVADALRTHEAESWRWRISPVVVAWGNGPPDAGAGPVRVHIRLPASALEAACNVRIELEGGEIIERVVRLSAAKATAEAQAGRERLVELSLALPRLPFGYHRLCVETGGHAMRSLVIAAPRKAYAAEHEPAWGVFLPLYALHSKRSWGIGDYTDLGRLIEWAGEQGAGAVATLPLLPTFLDDPFVPSPYEPVSRLFWNEVFVDPEGAPSPEGVDIARLAGQARTLVETPEVDYARVMALKREAMEAQSKAMKAGSAASAEMHAYLETRPDLGDYAAFRAAMERLGRDWRRWPERQRAGDLRAKDYEEGTARYYEYAQWKAHCQMRETEAKARALGMRSYLDLPVGVHQQGYDAWRYRSVFAQGITVGAPPDLLATNGQNWGFQPLIPKALRESGYEYMVCYLRHYFGSAKMLRIDHAIGLHRLYWIPEGATGRDGVFVRQPAEEMYAVLCLESMRNEAVVVAEDLGLVPPEVGRGLKAHGISGMYVQMFEMTGRRAQPMRQPRPHSVASFSTHDLPAFAAYWRDIDLEQREALGLLTAERVAEEKAKRTRDRKALAAYLKGRGLVRNETDVGQVFRGSTALLAESEAEWVMLNLEDTWGEMRGQNLPGTTSQEHGNWVSRAAYSLDEFESVEGLTKAIKTVKAYRGDGRTQRGARQASAAATEQTGAARRTGARRGAD